MRKIATILTLSALVLLGGSCSKDDPTYPFRVIAVDAEGTPIQGAYVRAFVPLPNVDIEYTGYTGLSGRVSFTHEGGEAVLQVQVTKGNPGDPAGAGCGFVKLEPDETAEIRIVMGLYDPDDPGC